MSLDQDAIMNALRTVPDPEMPISIVDLGLVEDVRIEHASDVATDGAHIAITILPTFVGCPALDMIRDDIETAVKALDGVGEVEVVFTNQPPWSVDRISDAGRESLRQFGVTVPPPGSGETLRPREGEDVSGAVTLTTSVVPCPFCGSTNTRLDSPFGPTRCRMIFYCDACRNPFEHMKKV